MYFKHVFLLLSFLIFKQLCQAQQKAVTESGDEVILYKNGTWKYSKEFNLNDSDKIELSPLRFVKSKNASFLLKSAHGNIGYWIDPKKWTFGKSASNPNADFELEFKGQSLNGIIISEPADIPIESYVTIAIQNGRQAAPDLRITHKEYRMVNGLKVLHLQMEGTQSGIKFLYYAYYYSNENATVQFLVVSYANAKKNYADEAVELLNGLTILPATAADGSAKDSVPGTGNDIVTQGIYSPNNKCKQLFAGNWSYSMSGNVVYVERSLKKTTEYLENRKYSFEYENRWTSDCSYDMIFKGTTKPNYKLVKVGEVFKVDILEIDKKSMRYNAVFRGNETKGEMLRNEKQ